jgi:hypothetical protein
MAPFLRYVISTVMPPGVVKLDGGLLPLSLKLFCSFFIFVTSIQG